MDRKIDVKLRSLPQPGIDIRHRPVLAQDSKDSGQAQSVAFRLCGEEGVKNLPDGRLIHALPLVTHYQFDAAPRVRRVRNAEHRPLLGQSSHAGGDADDAISRLRLHGVEAQVQDDLFDLAAIGQDFGQSTPQGKDQFVLLPDRGAYQGSHLVERVIEIGGLGVVATGTGVGEQVSDELTRAQAGVLD